MPSTWLISIADTIAWLPSGKSFCISNKEKFVNTILPKFFKSKASFSSFERRLKVWGFQKIDTTTHLYILSHDSFTKDSLFKADSLNDQEYRTMKQLRVVLGTPECQPHISWLPSGNSFSINHKNHFINHVLYKYFGETSFETFISTLISLGFKRIDVADFVGGAVYSHEMFQIGRPDLCARMSRGQDAAAREDNWEFTSGASAGYAGSLDGGMSNGVAIAAVDSACSADQGTMNPGSYTAQLMNHHYLQEANRMMQRMNSSNSMLQTQSRNNSTMGFCEFGAFPPIASMQHTATSSSNRSPLLAQGAMSQAALIAARRMQQQTNNFAPLHQYVSTGNVPQQLSESIAKGAQHQNDAGNGGTADEIKLAMLNIDAELLKIKELKLLAMKKKLMQMQMSEKKDE